MRAKLAELSAGLHAAASGEVTARAAAKVQSQIAAVGARIVAKHKASGNAASTLTVTTSGALVQLTAESYLGFHAWWIFRGGKMPPFVISSAVKIFAAELAAAITGKASPLLVAADLAEALAAEKSRAKFKADTAKIHRQSAEGKAKARASRKNDKLTRAREARE